MSETYTESRAAFLVRSNAEAIRERRDIGYMSRLIESFADSFHSPAATADVVNLAPSAAVRLSELTGDDLETTLRKLNQSGVAKLSKIMLEPPA